MSRKAIASRGGITNSVETCPQCSAPLGQIVQTRTGRQLQRCSNGSWNEITRKSEGCAYVKWLPFEPQLLDEPCPKCAAPLTLRMTRAGKLMKKCSTGGWDQETKSATGCEYVEWFKGSKEQLDELCPDCGKPLLLVKTANGQQLKKCSTAGWDRTTKQVTGCTFIHWLT